MGPSCNSLNSWCTTAETYPSGTSSCRQWPCQPGQACTATNGCSGTCVYTAPSSSYSGAHVACVASPSSQVCGSTCCGADQICSDGACKPRCGNSPYDPATQCCVSQEVLPKFQIADLTRCPNRTARPGWNPSDPSHVNGCGPVGLGLLVRDNYGLADFNPGCNAHDACYGTCNSNRSNCDFDLAFALKNACKSAYPAPLSAERRKCLDVALVYYTAVDLRGGGVYGDAQKEACICCP
ncbi:hypothetical protein [Vitiosangium sp. GDMCC 1.1324]|uniref:hypothetical protein n=1 Tax=Vitiosangium sp. (strain GDMCC 1.1324) TaxID=2138576 RepID=UPI0035180AB3